MSNHLDTAQPGQGFQQEASQSLLQNLPYHTVIVNRDLNIVCSNLDRLRKDIEDQVIGKHLFNAIYCEEIDREAMSSMLYGCFGGPSRMLVEDKKFKMHPLWEVVPANLFASGMDGSADLLIISLIDQNMTMELQFQLDLIYELGFFMVRTLNLNSVLYLILTGITAGPALGFNRALVFLLDERKENLKGALGVGPSNAEEAGRIWSKISHEKHSLVDFLSEYDTHEKKHLMPMTVLANDLSCPMNQDEHILVKTVREKKIFHYTKPELCSELNSLFYETYQRVEFITIPLLIEDEVLGVIIADNRFNWRPIEEKQKNILSIFANLAGISVKNSYRHKELLETLEKTKDASLQLERANRKLRNIEQQATVGRMAGFVAHEIRNPLAIIGGFARSTLKNIEKIDKVKRNAQIIMSEIERLEELLSDVLDYLRDQVPKIEQADLNNLVKEVCEQTQMISESDNITFKFEADEAVPNFHFDKKMIKQAILNICKNAVSHSHPNTSIRLKTKLQGREVHLSISNDGPGINKESARRLFEPFYTTHDSGSGLGLTITKRIIEGHRGTLSFQSEENSETTFFITLPINN